MQRSDSGSLLKEGKLKSWGVDLGSHFFDENTVMRPHSKIRSDQNISKFRNQWFDCICGGYEISFEYDGMTIKLSTEDGIRGIGYKSIVAFDDEIGVVYFPKNQP